MPLEAITDRILEEARKKSDSLLSEAEQEKARIIGEAKEKAKKIQEEAKKQASEIVDEIKKEYFAELEIERHNAILTAHERVAEKEFNKVSREMLNEIIKNYKKILDSALNRLKEEGVDAKIVAEKNFAPILKNLGYIFDECSKGVFALSNDGKISIDVSPEKIIENEKEHAKSMIIKELFKSVEKKAGKGESSKKKVNMKKMKREGRK
ncbi:MAG: hypothetical protein RXR32_03030 [Candidatus Micrarchaeota archaeon]